ncbi:MAG: T9SS type A sorting domain-containing protein [Ignavibacteriaceae bacterium]|nr:T9SS type A sorting domain-containing protein [Ignavibacteriaceae bacterium]
MKKLFVFIFLSWSFIANSQTMIESFDNIAADTNFVWTSAVEGGASYQIVTTDLTDKVEGAASIDVVTSIDALHQWGSFSQLQYRFPEGVTQDWSMNDTLKIWIKVVKAPTLPANMLFRVTIFDRDGPANSMEAYIMDNFVAIDAVTGWYQLKIPFRELDSKNGTLAPGDSGFVMTPYNWGGFTWNDHKFNKDKIVGWNIGFITSGWDPNANIPADSLELKLDGFVRSGNKPVPQIFFNGKTIPTALGTVWTWGQSTASFEENAGPVTGLNAVKWVQGNEWNNGWSGIGWNISPIFNMASSWPVDSLQFKMKVDEGVGPIRIQFEDGSGKIGKVFQPLTDNAWHKYVLALKDFTLQDNTTGFDSSKVSVFGIMAEASAIAGKVIYMSEIWTGNPVFDVIAPSPPAGLGTVNGNYQNLVTWTDVPGETGETYNVYSSDEQITDVTKAEVVKLNIAHGTQLVEHILRAPNTDQNVTKYYAVVCKDAAGNISDPAFLNTATTNTGKGVPTIAKTAPANFKADGDLSEWVSANVPKIEILTSNGTGFAVDNKPINGDADLSVTAAYIAVDNDNLYFAADVTDDIYTWLSTVSSYQNDCVDLFLGLFDSKNTSFSSYQRGATPHYHFRFDEQQIRMEGGANLDSIFMNNGGANYYFGQKFTPGYIIEAKIPFVDLAHRRDSGDLDSVFVPVEGMKIPIDFSINDNDGASTASDGGREGILCYSPFNNDQSWGDASRWLWTWIGNKMTVGVNDEANNNVVNSFNLAQNYPNPFNPSTKITYSLQNPELVTLRVFDVLGREVATLVNQYQTTGNHTVSFNASSLASGMYFYKLEAGSFQNLKKMMLLK